MMEQLRMQQKPPYERCELPMTTGHEYGFYNTNPLVRKSVALLGAYNTFPGQTFQFILV